MKPSDMYSDVWRLFWFWWRSVRSEGGFRGFATGRWKKRKQKSTNGFFVQTNDVCAHTQHLWVQWRAVVTEAWNSYWYPRCADLGQSFHGCLGGKVVVWVAGNAPTILSKIYWWPFFIWMGSKEELQDFEQWAKQQAQKSLMKHKELTSIVKIEDLRNLIMKLNTLTRSSIF